MRKNVFLLLLAAVLMALPATAGCKVVKVLAIGNSFSVDAVEQYLYELAHAQGDSLVIGNAYIGGCTIDRHWENAQGDKAAYSYRKIVGGVKTERNNATLREMIIDEDWDIITMQQASNLSGQIETYHNLQPLYDYVARLATNRRVRYAFHMTWAYAQNSTHPGFPYYGSDQMQMFRAIGPTVAQATKTVGIKRVIPSGIAIQAARATMGDVMCRDGYHLSLDLGRYVAACTWCEFLTGHSVVGNAYRPSALSPSQATLAQQAAHRASRRVAKKLKDGIF